MYTLTHIQRIPRMDFFLFSSDLLTNLTEYSVALRHFELNQLTLVALGCKNYVKPWGGGDARKHN